MKNCEFHSKRTNYCIFKMIHFLSIFLIVKGKTINELEYFINYNINISTSIHESTHLAWSYKDKEFFFANTNVSRRIFAYTDDAMIACSSREENNCETYTIRVGEQPVCVSDKSLIKCEDEEPTLWKISKVTNGFSLQYDDLCLTKDADIKPILQSCRNSNTQSFDFTLAALCTDPSHDVEHRIIDLEHKYNDGHHAHDMHDPRTYITEHHTQILGNDSVNYIVQKVLQAMGMHGGIPFYSQEGFAYPGFPSGLPNLQDNFSSNGNAISDNNHSMKKIPLHTEERKILPGTTTIETKTIPMKVRVKTRKMPGFVTIVQDAIEGDSNLEQQIDDDDGSMPDDEEEE